MEYLKDYEFELEYHLRKANVVADALSRKTQGTLTSIMLADREIFITIEEFKLENHPGKANVVADALSRKTQGTLMRLMLANWEIFRTIKEFNLEIQPSGELMSL